MYTSKVPLIAEVCKQGGSWPALWDTVRHLGSRHTVGLQHLSRMQASLRLPDQKSALNGLHTNRHQTAVFEKF